MTPVRKNPKNDFAVVRVHYSLDPTKDEVWKEQARRGMTERAWNREYEIDYTYFAGKPFFPEFSEYNILPQVVPYLQGETLYRGWDFGFHRPCVVITKLNEFDQWIIMRVILGQDEGIRDFGKRVKNYCLANFPGAKYIDACDVAGNQQTDKAETTSTQMLNAMGIYPQSRKQPKTLGAEIIRQKLKIRIDGKPGLLVNPTESYVISAFRGGLHYPEVKEGVPKEEYEKDGYFDHFGDSLRYIGVEMFTIVGETTQGNDFGFSENKQSYLMGRKRISENMHAKESGLYSAYDPLDSEGYGGNEFDFESGF